MAYQSFTEPDDAALDLSKAEAKLTELAEMFAAEEISRREWLRARKGIESRLDDARRRLARRNGTNALERFRGADAPALYRTLDVDERMAVISAVLDHITINPAQTRAPKLDVDRVSPVWKA